MTIEPTTHNVARTTGVKTTKAGTALLVRTMSTVNDTANEIAVDDS
jgi:hypothetical protein